MSKSKIFLFFCLSFVCGIALRSFVHIPFLWIYITLLITILGLVLFWQNNKFRYALFGIIFIILGTGRVDTQMNRLANLRDNNIFLNTQQFQAIVMQEPEFTDSGQKILVNTKNNINVLIHARFYPEYKYGDKLNITCDIQKIGLNNFGMFMLSLNIAHQCKYPKITIVSAANTSWFKTVLISARQKFNNILTNSLPAPESSLMSGLLLGAKSNFSQELKELFNKTGTRHIVALSGWNITIIINIIAFILTMSLIHPRYGFWLTVMFIIFFVTMVGESASIVRAALMGTAVLIAQKCGRLAKPINVLIFTLTIMLILNPMILRWDIGFQLSFLAMIGLIYLDPILTQLFIKYRYKLRGPKPTKNQNINHVAIITKTFISTISAQITTIPFIMYSFHSLPILSPITNLLIMPLVPTITILGFIVGATGLISSTLSVIIGFFVWPLLKYVLIIIKFFASLDIAAISVDHISPIVVIIYYASIVFIIKKIQTHIQNSA